MKKLDALTSLRFFAAYAIVIHHSKDFLGREVALLERLPLDQAVSFFFVLSGFILMYVHPRIEGTRGAARFIVARIARLWPLHIVTGVGLFYVLYRKLLFIQPIKSYAIANVLLVHSWIPKMSVYYAFNAVSWAVAAEFFFYLCYPWLARDFARTWRAKLAASFIPVVAFSLFFNTLQQGPGGEVWGMSPPDLLYINPLSRVFEFVLGMCFGMAYSRTSNRQPSGRGFGPTLKEAIALLLACVSIYASIPFAVAIGTTAIGSGATWFVHSGSCVFFGLMIYVFAFGRGHISRALSIKPLVFLGELSYAIFLAHQIVLRYFADIKKKLHIEALTGWSEYALYLALMFSIAYILWRFVENPARKLILRLSPKKA